MAETENVLLETNFEKYKKQVYAENKLDEINFLNSLSESSEPEQKSNTDIFNNISNYNKQILILGFILLIISILLWIFSFIIKIIFHI